MKPQIGRKIKGVYPRSGKNGITWYIEYKYKGMRYREAIGPSKRDAEAAYMARMTDINNGKFFDKRIEKSITFSDFCDTYYNTHMRLKAPGTAARFLDAVKRLKRYFSGYLMTEITAKHIKQYQAKRLDELAHNKKTNVSPSTINREIAIIRNMFNMGIEWGDFIDNPVKKGIMFNEKDFARNRFLSQDEAVKLYNELKGHLKPIVIVTLNTGMRLGEVLSLKWKDCNFEQRKIYLPKTKTGKKEKPMNQIVYDTLVAWPKHPTSDYIFCHPVDTPHAGFSGKPFRSIKTAWNKAIEKAGIDNFRFHDLRHTFASYCVMSGVDMKTVSELLGHKTMVMTERYSHLSDSHKQKAVERLSMNFGFGKDATKAPQINKGVVDNFQLSDEKIKEAVSGTGLL